MDNYYYHGIECYAGVIGYVANIVTKILEEGIITRNAARKYNDDNLNHICLYKKNNEYDYDSPNAILHSARGGWIDHSFVFIINPQIEARKATKEETNLVDEWRCYNNISPKDIVGIALPLEVIENYLNDEHIEEEKDDVELLKTSLTKIKKMTKILNIPIYDSDKKDFTDELDSKLQHTK